MQQEAILAFLRQRDKLHDRDFVVGSRQHFDASSRNTTATDTAVSDEKIESIITQCGIQEDVALDLSSSGLKTLPRNLAGLHKLRQIFLNKNRMEELPLCLCELSDLIGSELAEPLLTLLLDFPPLPRAVELPRGSPTNPACAGAVSGRGIGKSSSLISSGSLWD